MTRVLPAPFDGAFRPDGLATVTTVLAGVCIAACTWTLYITHRESWTAYRRATGAGADDDERARAVARALFPRPQIPKTAEGHTRMNAAVTRTLRVVAEGTRPAPTPPAVCWSRRRRDTGSSPRSRT